MHLPAGECRENLHHGIEIRLEFDQDLNAIGDGARMFNGFFVDVEMGQFFEYRFGGLGDKNRFFVRGKILLIDDNSCDRQILADAIFVFLAANVEVFHFLVQVQFLEIGFVTLPGHHNVFVIADTSKDIGREGGPIYKLLTKYGYDVGVLDIDSMLIVHIYISVIVDKV
jgi:hypothetical protein